MADAPGGRSGSGSDSILEHIAQERATNTKGTSQFRSARSQSTVLVVDDEPAVRYATARQLQSAGFKTLETASGYEALDLAGRAAAVVLDVNLPDLHGVEVCSILRKREATERLPVVLTSAVYVDELHRDAGLSSGADAYLIAPLNPDELTAILDRLLGN
ncbi:MAG: two-component system response regulator [Ramlibacter sp.]